MSKPSSRRRASRSAWLAIPLWSMTATGSPEMCSIAETTTVTPARAIRANRIRRWRYAFTESRSPPGTGRRRRAATAGGATRGAGDAAENPEAYLNETSSNVISSSERAFQLTLLLAP